MPPVLKPNPPNRAAGTVPVKTTVKRARTPKTAPGPSEVIKQGEHGPKDEAPVTKNTTLTGGINGR